MDQTWNIRGCTLILFHILSLSMYAQVTGTKFVPRDQYYGYATWNVDSLGTHRVVLKVGTKAPDAVRAYIPWRRRDLEPEKKKLLIVDAATSKPVTNAVWITVNRECGDVVFQPPTIPGEYYVYYLFYRSKGGNYPKGRYLPSELGADDAWVARHKLNGITASSKTLRAIPEAEIVQFQSIDTLNTFYPMEVIATGDEVRSLLKQYPKDDYLVFPEDRHNSIRMTTDIPYKWIKEGVRKHYALASKRGEYMTFQLGVYAAHADVRNLSVEFTDLMNNKGMRIPATMLSSFNTDGTDWLGKRIHPDCSVKKGSVQPLWIGIGVPEAVTPGQYSGDITITPLGKRPWKLTLDLTVLDTVIQNHGDDDPYSMSRLRWLNSQLAAGDEIVPPFEPVSFQKEVYRCLGRSVTVNPIGLPKSIKSYFSPEVTSITNVGKDILAAPIELAILDTNQAVIPWDTDGFVSTSDSGAAVTWKSNSRVGGFSVDLSAKMEFDGYVDYQITLTATNDLRVGDIRLDVPFTRNAATYMMGLGRKGGLRPQEFEWKWNPKFNHDAYWIGDVNAGMQVSFRDTNYARPLNTNFYQLKPLNMPPSWYNDGKGGMQIIDNGSDRVTASMHSRDRSVKKGEHLHFYFSLLITPFKPINTDWQWRTRFYHKYEPVDTIIGRGANTINVHHATGINPYLNYPFLRPGEMKAYVDEAHSKRAKVKIYYTVRELTNRSPEFFMLKSLGDEIFSKGTGGGFSWLQEHLDQDYITGWFVPELKDAALVTSGVSRWHNYYVEGLNWLVRNVGIDGLYIDDVAFDRTTMKRVRRVLDRNRTGALIDLHSANQFNPNDGFVNSANLYLEHFPYINRLWFGEYFDYSSAPDFWLVEVSGLPFGLMGEMLEGGGNPWRGMIYGMTARLPWAGDPTPVWKLWDDFGMEGTRMFGYWSPACPVKTDTSAVLATAYVKKGAMLVSVASWATSPVQTRLFIDWKAAGMDPADVEIRAPFARGFQEGRSFKADEKIPIEPGKGWVLYIKAKDRN